MAWTPVFWSCQLFHLLELALIGTLVSNYDCLRYTQICFLSSTMCNPHIWYAPLFNLDLRSAPYELPNTRIFRNGCVFSMLILILWFWAFDSCIIYKWNCDIRNFFLKCICDIVLEDCIEFVHPIGSIVKWKVPRKYLESSEISALCG